MSSPPNKRLRSAGPADNARRQSLRSASTANTPQLPQANLDASASASAEEQEQEDQEEHFEGFSPAKATKKNRNNRYRGISKSIQDHITLVADAFTTACSIYNDLPDDVKNEDCLQHIKPLFDAGVFGQFIIHPTENTIDADLPKTLPNIQGPCNSPLPTDQEIRGARDGFDTLCHEWGCIDGKAVKGLHIEDAYDIILDIHPKDYCEKLCRMLLILERTKADFKRDLRKRTLLNGQFIHGLVQFTSGEGNFHDKCQPLAWYREAFALAALAEEYESGNFEEKKREDINPITPQNYTRLLMRIHDCNIAYKLPKEEPDKLQGWTPALTQGRVWNSWCKAFGNGRGILLLLMVVKSREYWPDSYWTTMVLKDGSEWEVKGGNLLEDQIRWISKYAAEYFPFFAKMAKILDPFALQIYGGHPDDGGTITRVERRAIEQQLRDLVF